MLNAPRHRVGDHAFVLQRHSPHGLWSTPEGIASVITDLPGKEVLGTFHVLNTDAMPLTCAARRQNLRNANRTRDAALMGTALARLLVEHHGEDDDEDHAP